MNHQPLVSAIIIFLNEERFLQEAVDSVFAQTYGNWELLLVDDGSTDQSSMIAQCCAAAHPEKVRYLEHNGHANRGMSASRNLGVANAKGTYISYLDGDDIWNPNKLERQLTLLGAHPEAVMVYGPLQCWHSWTGDPNDQNRDYLYGLEAYGVRLEADRLIEPPKLLSSFLPYEQLIPSGVMVEREVLQRIGRSEEAFRGSYEDAVVHVKICLVSKVFVSSECWYKYRIHPDSSERRMMKAGKAAETRLLFLHWVHTYLVQQTAVDPSVFAALDDALWPYHHPYLHRVRDFVRSVFRALENATISLGKLVLSPSIRSWLWSQKERYSYRSLK